MKVINYPAMASPPSIIHIGNIISKYCYKNSNILDPFCGTGRLLINPRISGHKVTGIDCSPIALLASRVIHQKLNIRKAECALDNLINFNTKHPILRIG